MRRVGRDLDRLVATAIVQVSIESQTAESRVAQLSVFEPGVLDDRDQAWTQEANTVAHRDGRRKGRRDGREVTGRHVEPLAKERRHVGVTGKNDRAIFTAHAAQERPRATLFVDDESTDD